MNYKTMISVSAVLSVVAIIMMAFNAYAFSITHNKLSLIMLFIWTIPLYFNLSNFLKMKDKWNK